jgi:hypothetical protein
MAIFLIPYLPYKYKYLSHSHIITLKRKIPDEEESGIFAKLYTLREMRPAYASLLNASSKLVLVPSFT